jgi:predicted amidohydrolase YtcJ
MHNGAGPRLIVGTIRTMDDLRPEAEAMLIVGDRVSAIGSVEQVRELAPDGIVEERFAGVIVPGFIDAHSHAQRAGLKALQLLPEGSDSAALSAVMLADGDADPDAADWLGDAPPLIEDRLAALRLVQPLLHAMGFTGVIDPAVTIDELDGYREAHRRNELTLRVVAMPWPQLGTPAVPTVEAALEVLDGIEGTTGDGDDRLRLGPIKVYYDGEGMKGQALLETPWTDNDHGVQRLSAAEFARLAAECVSRGWGLGVHAVGSRAVAEVLTGLESAAAPEVIEPLRCQLIHAYLEPSDDSMRMAARLGVVASLQPSIAWNNAAGLARRLGDRVLPVNPMRDWVDAGAVVAMGSDAPYFPFNPREVIPVAVDRRMRGLDEPVGPEQGISVSEAVQAYTRGAAYASFAEDRRGMLRENFLADWVLLDVDPTRCSAAEFAASVVLRTEVGGVLVFEMRNL